MKNTLRVLLAVALVAGLLVSCTQVPLHSPGTDPPTIKLMVTDGQGKEIHWFHLDNAEEGLSSHGTRLLFFGVSQVEAKLFSSLFEKGSVSLELSMGVYTVAPMGGQPNCTGVIFLERSFDEPLGKGKEYLEMELALTKHEDS